MTTDKKDACQGSSMKAFAVTGTICAIILVAGCGGGTHDPSTAKASSSPSPTGPSSYGAVVDLRDAAVDAGYECPSWKEDDAVNLAASSGACSDADVLAVFATEQDKQDQVSTYRSLNKEFGDLGSKQLVGPNWIINSSNDLEALRVKLGGTIVK